jgi:hypothetical protein
MLLKIVPPLVFFFGPTSSLKKTESTSVCEYLPVLCSRFLVLSEHKAGNFKFNLLKNNAILHHFLMRIRSLFHTNANKDPTFPFNVYLDPDLAPHRSCENLLTTVLPYRPTNICERPRPSWSLL